MALRHSFKEDSGLWWSRGCLGFVCFDTFLCVKLLLCVRGFPCRLSSWKSLSQVFCCQQRQRQIKAASCVCQRPPWAQPTSSTHQEYHKQEEWLNGHAKNFLCLPSFSFARIYNAFNILVNVCSFSYLVQQPLRRRFVAAVSYKCEKVCCPSWGL